MVAERPDPQALRDAALTLLDQHWREPGYTCPNDQRYPWMWLWDSCFHSIVWAELARPDRAVSELRTALAEQDPTTGFVPHMTYVGAPDTGTAFWGRPRTSSITQPPMYGHAVAELVRRGVEVPGALVEQARAGLEFLMERRRRSSAGLVELVHPWESGADDSPRWDDWCPPSWDLRRWRDVKGELLATIVRSESGAPLANDRFAVGSAGFTALVAFNALELGQVTDDERLVADAQVLVEALDARWDAGQRTWVDDGPSAEGSGRARTAESLLGLLVTQHPDARRAVVEDLVDRTAFGATFGPTGVHRDEPSFDPSSYWRGPSWPQLTYLLTRACEAVDEHEVARRLGESMSSAAWRSGWAEYWDADTGEGGGAVPQSWTALAVLV